MIAMQYSFALPSDYDMDIIAQRIADKGHFTDALPGLIFKAYLSADKNAKPANSQDNLYAPFYLWEDSDAMNRFLCSDMFVGLTQAFGWPAVKTWSVWASRLGPQLASARFATRETSVIAPHISLLALQERENASVQAMDSDNGALASISAYEPTSWTLLRINLWKDHQQEQPQNGVQAYEVGHISMPPR
jgi:hypothetical protein